MADEVTLFQMLEQARSYVDERKYLHASQVYHRIVALEPSLEPAWVELSHVYCELKKYDAAERILHKALPASNDPNKISFLIGNLYLKLGQHSRALVYYRQLMVKERELSQGIRAHLQFNAALCYFYKGNFKLAETHFRRTRKIDPYFPKINESLGELLLRREAVSEAIHVLRKAIVTDPYSWIGHYLLGLSYARLRDWKGAYEEFVSAVEMDPNEPTGWQMCGEALLSLRQFDEAEQYLRKALELNPHLSDAIANFGFLCLYKGDHEGAEAFFERALSLEPRNPKALRGKIELKQSGKALS